MSEKILFVLEGENTEKQILDNIKKRFFTNKKEVIFYVTYNAEIYQLWEEMKDDDFLDLLDVLKERSEENRTSLKELKKDDISQIYLFFDYDGHATKASDDVIQKMLEYFNNETESGKLYISYPMVEALKDLGDEYCFKDKIVLAKQNIGYKTQVGLNKKYQDSRKIEKSDWHFIILENSKKANFIVNDNYTEPEDIILQDSIFAGQLERFIKPHNKVAVLSGFPLFLAEYYGKDLYNQLTI